MGASPELYERLGGCDGIDSLVIAFYTRVMTDPALSPFFRHTELEKLHTMQREFFTMALGGTVSYSGKPLGHAHHGRGITAHHFKLFVDHLVATLEDQGVGEEDARQVIGRINGFANEITGTSY